MRIESLLELIDPEVSHKQYRGKLRDTDADTFRSNSGAFSTVVPDRHDPHMVRKHHHDPIVGDTDSEDAFVHFVNWMIEEKIQNIHFPRIYNVKKITDSEGKYIYKYQIEKLIPANKLSKEELLHVVHMNFDVESIKEENTRARWDAKDTTSIIRAIGEACERVITGEGDRSIKSRSIVKALNEILNFNRWAYERDLYAHLDLVNSGNIMFRRTPQGLQIVFSDPVA